MSSSVTAARSLTNTRGTIALAGAGKMGGAMLAGWLAGGLDANRVVVVEPFPSDDIKALAAKGVRLNPKRRRSGRFAGGRGQAADVPRSGSDAEASRRIEYAGGLDHGGHDDCGA